MELDMGLYQQLRSIEINYRAIMNNYTSKIDMGYCYTNRMFIIPAFVDEMICMYSLYQYSKMLTGIGTYVYTYSKQVGLCWMSCTDVTWIHFIYVYMGM